MLSKVISLHDKLKVFLYLENIILEDKNGHKFYGDYATYDENEKFLSL